MIWISMESVVKAESFLWIFPHQTSPWQVWFEVGTFWTSAGFRFCGYVGEGTFQGAGCGFARWHPVVCDFDFRCTTFSLLSLFVPSIRILYINRMNRPRSRVRTWIFRRPRSSGSEFSRMARDCGWMEEKFVDQADHIQPGWYVCFLHYFSLSYRSFAFQTCVGWKILGMNWWSWGKKIGRCDRWWMRR